MPSGVWPLEGFYSHNHLLCMSNIPRQAATLLHDQTTVRNCLCSKTRPKAQTSAQTKISVHTESYISRQKLCCVQRNCKGVMNNPVVQHKSIPVIACLQSSIHPAAFPPSPSKLKLHSEYPCRMTRVTTTSMQTKLPQPAHKCARCTWLCVYEHKSSHKHICNQISCNI